MIITKLMGGLGNQMFQYASAYGIAKKNDTTPGIDQSWYTTTNSSVWTMSYELDCFNLSGKLIDPSQYSTGKSNPLKAIFKKPYAEYKENGLPFDSATFTLGKNVALDGYWQSEKYFVGYRQNILKEYSFNFLPEGRNKELAEAIKSTNAVSLHVRRGDYASHSQTNSVHGLITLDYYRAAIENITKRVGDVHFFVFSDEPEWCEENLPIDQPHTFVSGNKKGCYDMQLMSMCKHHIIANSSFSWWGAWLNPSDSKIVIAPKRWFNDPDMNAQTKDLVPETWERL